MLRAFFTVAALAWALLLIRAASVGIADDYLDPITKIPARDEARYANRLTRLAERAGLLRQNLAGDPTAEARVRLALRFPVVLASALALGLLFLIAAQMRAWQAGAFAVILLLSNRLWMVPASMVLPVGALAALEIAAMYFLFADPWLESRAAFWGLAGCLAGAVLVKGFAAAPVAVAFTIYCCLAPARWRPAVLRALAVFAAAAALAVVWYICQTLAHTGWSLPRGAGTPSQATEENAASFYLKRFVWVDPILFALAITGAPAWFAALRKRSAEATLLACWLAAMLGALFVWPRPSAAYLIPCLAPIAVAAGVFAPIAKQSAWWMAAILAGAFAMKLAMPWAPWGLSFTGAKLP